MQKKKFKIHYLSIAERDILEIIDFISKKNPTAAINLIDEIDKQISKLADFPEIGKLAKDDRLKKLGYRILVVKKYLVFYVVKKQSIEIRRILHGKRKYEFLW
jgi:toxin ParE1/3/4